MWRAGWMKGKMMLCITSIYYPACDANNIANNMGKPALHILKQGLQILKHKSLNQILSLTIVKTCVVVLAKSSILAVFGKNTPAASQLACLSFCAARG
jgi:hypothetical protein